MELRITSRENEKVKQLCKTAESASFVRHRNYLAEGVRLFQGYCRRLAAAGSVSYGQGFGTASELQDLPGRHVMISQSVADKISDQRTRRGIFCVFERALESLDQAVSADRWLVLEHVQDPANIGALLRSAAAFGFEERYFARIVPTRTAPKPCGPVCLL